MKPSIVFLFLLLLSAFAQGQDIIKTRSGTILRGKVTNVTTTTITYKPDTADTVSTTLNISELAGINYANGSKDIFEDEEPAFGGNKRDSLMRIGQIDARNGYKQYHPAKTLTTVITALEG